MVVNAEKCILIFFQWIGLVPPLNFEPVWKIFSPAFFELILNTLFKFLHFQSNEAPLISLQILNFGTTDQERALFFFTFIDILQK